MSGSVHKTTTAAAATPSAAAAAPFCGPPCVASPSGIDGLGKLMEVFGPCPTTIRFALASLAQPPNGSSPVAVIWLNVAMQPPVLGVSSDGVPTVDAASPPITQRLASSSKDRSKNRLGLMGLPEACRPMGVHTAESLHSPPLLVFWLLPLPLLELLLLRLLHESLVLQDSVLCSRGITVETKEELLGEQVDVSDMPYTKFGRVRQGAEGKG